MNVIEVTNLSKKFTSNLRRSMLYGTIDIARDFVGIKYDTNFLRKGEFWALNNINFKLKKGQTLGLLGSNGSGKSTLMRIINGIYPPDNGTVSVKGRIGALIALGAGFHPHLTGKENIYLNGTILGMSKEDINKKYNDIIDFADIGDFIDAPISTYSSGMKVRLGFSIAIHAPIDIILADEVLAVGDVNFQKRSFEKILELRGKGISTIFVSHSISQLERICEQGLHIEKGNQIFFGNIREATKSFIDYNYNKNLEKAKKKRVRMKDIGIGNFIAGEVKVYQKDNNVNDNTIEFGKDIVIEIPYKFIEKKSEEFQFRITVRTYEGHDVQKFFFHEKTFNDGIRYDNENIIQLKKEGTVKLIIENQCLFPQTYLVDVAVQSIDKVYHEGGTASAAEFRIIENKNDSYYFEYGNLSVVEFEHKFIAE